MRQLSDILIEKIQKVGGKAALGRMLGGLTGQAILQYTQGGMPSLTFAIRWKEAFGENLIDLMFEEERVLKSEASLLMYEETLLILSEAKPKYQNQTLIAELNDTRKKLISCMEEKEELKKFLPVGEPAELKAKHQKK